MHGLECTFSLNVYIICTRGPVPLPKPAPTAWKEFRHLQEWANTSAQKARKKGGFFHRIGRSLDELQCDAEPAWPLLASLRLQMHHGLAQRNLQTSRSSLRPDNQLTYLLTEETTLLLLRSISITLHDGWSLQAFKSGPPSGQPGQLNVRILFA